MDPDSRVTALRNTAYTKIGSKLSEENDTFQTTFQYDCMGHVIRESETGGVVKAYGHDWNGNRTAFTLDKGAENVLSTGYDYDKLNRMYIVREQGETIATYTYDDNGNRASLSYPDGTVTTYAYNLTNLVTRLINANGEDTLSAYEYTYYLNGNQASKADHEGKVTTYAYDELGQLQAEEESTGLRIAYDYDRFGNRAQMRVTGDGDYTVTYEYDKNNRLLRDVKRGRCYGEYGKRHSR